MKPTFRRVDLSIDADPIRVSFMTSGPPTPDSITRLAIWLKSVEHVDRNRLLTVEIGPADQTACYVLDPAGDQRHTIGELVYRDDSRVDATFPRRVVSPLGTRVTWWALLTIDDQDVDVYSEAGLSERSV